MYVASKEIGGCKLACSMESDATDSPQPLENSSVWKIKGLRQRIEF